MEVSTKVQVDTIADVGSIGESGARAGRRGCSSSSLERCREASDCSGELPARGFCVGCGAAQRRERQPGVHLAASVSRAGWRGRWLGAGGCRAGRDLATSHLCIWISDQVCSFHCEMAECRPFQAYVALPDFLGSRQGLLSSSVKPNDACEVDHEDADIRPMARRRSRPNGIRIPAGNSCD